MELIKYFQYIRKVFALPNRLRTWSNQLEQEKRLRNRLDFFKID